MSNQNTNDDEILRKNNEILRKWNNRAQETAEKSEVQLACECELKCQKHAKEIEKKWDERLLSIQEKRKKKIDSETTDKREKRLAHKNEQKCNAQERNKYQQKRIEY